MLTQLHNLWTNFHIIITFLFSLLTFDSSLYSRGKIARRITISLLGAMGGVAPAKPEKTGGVASAKPATEETQNLICKVKAEMELQAGRSFDVFEAVSVASQVGGKEFRVIGVPLSHTPPKVVAGTNFFVKVRVGSESYVHARIYRGE